MTDGLVVTLARLADETAALKDTVYALVSREQEDPPSELGAALISALASLRTAEDELRRGARLAESESDPA